MALKIPPNNLKNIDIWNLRGRSVPMDKLAPKLIRRAKQKGYIAVIIDPIYKVITGDENSADQMAAFCNQFDKICTELGTAVIYCHHHSKGSQVGKRSMDMASGSGVFARDPDALLNMSELMLNDNVIKQQENKAVCEICMKYLSRFDKLDIASQDDLCSEVKMREACKKALSDLTFNNIMQEVEIVRKQIQKRTAWRVEGTLREFAKFEPVNLWFDYPVHIVDTVGVLKDVNSESDINSKNSPYTRNFGKKKTTEEKKKERNEAIKEAFDACNLDGKVTVSDIAEYMGTTEKTVRNKLKSHGGFWVDGGNVGLKGKENIE